MVNDIDDTQPNLPAPPRWAIDMFDVFSGAAAAFHAAAAEMREATAELRGALADHRALVKRIEALEAWHDAAQ